jgi:8-oxo-dGTP diphosphatase
MASSTSILVNNGKVLFILRDNKATISEPNTWQLPGGGVEEGENHFQTAQRELQEEIGIIPKKLSFIGSAPGDTKVFFAFLDDEEVKNIKLGNEGQKLEFFTIEEASNQNLTNRLRMYFEKFRDAIIELIKTGSLEDVSDIGLSK